MGIAPRTTNGFASANGTGNNASLAVTFGSAVLGTDAVVCVIGTNDPGSASYSAPSGWTAAFTAFLVSPHVWLGCWVAYGSVSNKTFTVSSGSTGGTFGWLTQAFTGVDQATIIDSHGVTNSNSGSPSINAATYNTSNSGALPVIAIIDYNDSSTYSATNYSVAYTSNGNSQPGLFYANSALIPAGATGQVTCNDSASSTGQVLAIMPFALKPFLAPPLLILSQAVRRSAYY